VRWILYHISLGASSKKREIFPQLVQPTVRPPEYVVLALLAHSRDTVFLDANLILETIIGYFIITGHALILYNRIESAGE